MGADRIGGTRRGYLNRHIWFASVDSADARCYFWIIWSREEDRSALVAVWPHSGNGLVVRAALGYLIFCELTGQGAFLHSGLQADWMMVGAGLVTTAPLLLFSSAARACP